MAADIALSPIQTFSLSADQKLLRRARDLYFADIYPTEICEQLNIDIEELGLYVFGADRTGQHPSCWMAQRALRPAASAITFERVKPVLLNRAQARLFKTVDRTVEEWDQSKHTFTDAKELKDATAALTELDKIQRLEEGKATEHRVNENRSFSLRDIVRMRNEGRDAGSHGHNSQNSTRPTDRPDINTTARSPDNATDQPPTEDDPNAPWNRDRGSPT